MWPWLAHAHHRGFLSVTCVLAYSLANENWPLANLTLFPVPVFMFIFLFSIRSNSNCVCCVFIKPVSMCIALFVVCATCAGNWYRFVPFTFVVGFYPHCTQTRRCCGWGKCSGRNIQLIPFTPHRITSYAYMTRTAQPYSVTGEKGQYCGGGVL